MTRPRRLRILFGLVSGMTLALAFPPYGMAWLAWISVAGLIFVSLDARGWVAFVAGMLHGIVFSAVSFSWIYTVMRVHGGLSPIEAAGVLGLLSAAYGLFSGTFAWAVCRISRVGVHWACLAAPFLWVAQDFARTHLPELGFPWNSLGYAATDQLGVMQFAALAGIYGVTFVLAAYNAVFAWLLAQRTRAAWMVWLAATVVLIPLALIGEQFLPEMIPGHVAQLVQPNLPQSTQVPADWNQRHAAELDDLERLSVAAAKAQPGLVVWPEVPAPLQLLDPEFRARAERIARSGGSPFLLGVIEWTPEQDRYRGPYNSAALLDAEGRHVFRYDKIHLVPFGEYVPWNALLRFARPLTKEVGSFQAGSEFGVAEVPPVRSTAGGQNSSPGKFGVFICYEAIFPNEMRQFARGGAELLINLSNDGWFGRSAAPEQHLAMARARAVENRRWLLRATNNGHTVAVDAYGRIRAQLAPDTRGVLAAPLNFRQDLTLYVRWGDWLPWTSLAVSVAFLGAALRRRRENEK